MGNFHMLLNSNTYDANREYVNVSQRSDPPQDKRILTHSSRRVESDDHESGCNLAGTVCLALTIVLIGSFLYVNSKLHLTGYADNSDRQKDRYINCENVKVFDAVDGKMDFIVAFEDLYPDRKVFKSESCSQGERVLRVGEFVVWHGTHDLNMQNLPLTLFGFESRMPEQSSRSLTDRRHFFEVRCPDLDNKLELAHYEWIVSKREQNTTTSSREDQFKEPRKLGEIDCTDFHVHILGTHEAHGRVGVSATITNPYRKEDTKVSKYPMTVDEEIVLTGNYMMWYGTYNLRTNTDGLLPKTVFAFESLNTTNSTKRHYYEFNCPDLEHDLKLASFHWWKDEKLWSSWCTFVIVSIVSSLTCCLGIYCGEKRGRDKAIRSFIR